MHRLLSIPEMVAAILKIDRTGNILLVSCLLVNRLFSHEAVRILWQRCGAGILTAGANSNPTTSHLAQIAAHDVLRAQYYADCIHELRLVYNNEEPGWPREWYLHLSRLRFPALRSFTVGSTDLLNPDRTSKFNKFLSERLESSWGIKNSMNLKEFHLVADGWSDFVAIESFTWFNRFAPIFSSFAVRPLYGRWSLDIMKSLASLPALHKLSGKNMSAKLLKDLATEFSNLKEIDVGYAGSFEYIASSFPHLEMLSLRISESIQGELGKLVSLSNLTSIKLTFIENSTISGSELLALANGCPNLRIFNLPPAGELMADMPCPRGESIDDSTMEKFARALPKIGTFSFGLQTRSTISYEAIVSLARHCPDLGYFNITADICIPDLIEGLEEVSRKISAAPLPSVSFIGFYLDEDHSHSYENIASLAERFIKLAPRLCESSITDGSEYDDEFQSQVDKLAYSWMRRVDTQD